MKQIRFIFFTLFFVLLGTSLYATDYDAVPSPLEELIDDVECGIYPLLKDFEDDSAILKNSRRSNSSTGTFLSKQAFLNDFITSSFNFSKKDSSSFVGSFNLIENDEITFLHLFHLY